MKNITNKALIAFAITTLTILQVSASTIDTNKQSLWSDFLSFFKSKTSIDCVAEDRLLESYMLTKTESNTVEITNESAITSVKLLNNYMFGENALEPEYETDQVAEDSLLTKYMLSSGESSEPIAYTNEIPVAFATDFEEENETESESIDYVVEDIILGQY